MKVLAWLALIPLLSILAAALLGVRTRRSPGPAEAPRATAFDAAFERFDAKYARLPQGHGVKPKTPPPAPSPPHRRRSGAAEKSNVPPDFVEARHSPLAALYSPLP